jgi:glycosyltransferase involved in cell wall biosynthesis
VVSDDCSMVDDISNKAGLVVPYEKDSITKALRTLLADAKMRNKFGQYARALVRKKYGWNTIAAEMEKVYERCFGK